MSALKSNINPQKKGKRFRFDFLIIACVVIFITCFVIYMFNGRLEPSSGANNSPSQSTSDAGSKDGSTADASSSEATTTVATTTSPPVTSPVNPVPQSEAATADYFNSCGFIGDSLTYGLKSYNLVPPKNVIASIGMNIAKIDTEVIDTAFGKVTALNAVKQLKPANVYIMLGSNGIAWLSNETMIQKYSGFIDSVRKELPNSKIYILSIPPVAVERETTTESPIQNSAIDSYNSELLKMANSKGILFVDINTALKNNKGKLDSSKAQKDGMHFQKDTYGVMVNYILTHIAK